MPSAPRWRPTSSARCTLCGAFAPVLAGNGGGAILNVLSALSWLSYQCSAGYAAAKAAAWSMTNSVRLELASQNTQVVALVMASTDTDMMAGFDIPKNDPAEVVRAALDGIETGEIEVIADADSRSIKAALAQHPSALYLHVVGAHPSGRLPELG